MKINICTTAVTFLLFIGSAMAAEPGILVGIAKSDDGQTFRAAGEVLMRDVSSPAIVRMGNGELLAICTQAGRTGERPRLLATRSKDDGRTWLPVRPVQIEGMPENAVIGASCLLAMPTGVVRMYFVTGGKADRGRDGTVILSAVTRDGVQFRLDRAARTSCRGMTSVRIAAVTAKESIVLLVAGERQGDTSSGSYYVQKLESADGRRFKSTGRGRAGGEIGCIVPVDGRHWRMYTLEDGQVRSRVSQDLARWRDEPGVRLQGAAEAAVVMLQDGKCVMLYSMRASEASASAKPLAGIGPSQQASADNADANTNDSWKPFASESAETDLAGGDGVSAIDQVVELPAVEFAPLPDLRNHFDYFGWARQFSVPAEQSAYGSYAGLFQTLETTEGSDIFNDRYNDPDAPPATPEPWNPLDFPSWEKTFQEKQEYMAMFREAGLDPRPYIEPIGWSEEVALQDRLLLNSISPPLAPLRLLTKATISQAWRAENGSIPPQQLLTAVETCLGNVAQLQESPAFINRCVAEANRKLVDDNVRWAIHYGVLQTPGDLASTMSLLQSKDLPDSDPGGFLRGQHAAAMEAIQYLFEPAVPGGQPVLRADRVDRFLDLEGWSPADREQYRQNLLELTPADAQAAIAETDSYFRKMAEWYQEEMPRPDPLQFDRLAEEISERNKLAGMFLPSVGRSNRFIQRTEAGRRATRLICSIELFRAQHGRYPASLDELSAEQVDDVRTDPFSGQDFVYRQSAAGPMIYSLSENGQDDGGAHSGGWGYDEPSTETGDYVFWPPQENKK